jgi:hypothetical protein
MIPNGPWFVRRSREWEQSGLVIVYGELSGLDFTELSSFLEVPLAGRTVS